MPNFSVNASASSADSGAVPDVTARTLARSSRVRSECSTIRSAAGTSDTARGRCSRTACAQVSSSKLRQQHERARLGDAQQHPKHAADVHQRRVHDGDPGAQSGWARGTDRGRGQSRCAPACRRSGRHAWAVRWFRWSASTPRHRGGPGPRRCAAAASDLRRCGRGSVTATSRGARDGRCDEVGDVGGRADEQRQSQRLDVGSGALVTAGRVDDHDGAAAGQHTEQRRDVSGLLRSRMPTRG